MDESLVNMDPKQIGDRIRQARIASGLTQDETVAALDARGVPLTKAGLSKYERGGSVPKPTVLRTLAITFGVESSYFLEEQETKVTWKAFRKAAQLSKTSERKVKAIAEEYIQAFCALRRALEPHREVRRVPTVPVHDVDDIEDAAQQLRDHWKLGQQPVESVTAAIEDGDGIVVEVDGEGDLFDGLSGWADDTTPVVVVSGSVSDDRRRFSLSHELGHLIMDIQVELNDKDEERWAHRFASAFLAPAEVARRELGEKRRRLDFEELALLKQKYGLSMQAWIMRALNLEIIEDSHARTLFAEMGRRGWRRTEPVEFHGEERPKRLKQLTVRALAEGVLSATQAERLVPNVTREVSEDVAAPQTAVDARVLRMLPQAERERLMERAAALVEKEYESGGDLTGFDALTEEDHRDDPFGG